MYLKQHGTESNPRAVNLDVPGIQEIPTVIEAEDDVPTLNDIPSTRCLCSTSGQNLNSTSFPSRIPILVRQRRRTAEVEDNRQDPEVLQNILKTNEKIHEQINKMKVQITAMENKMCAVDELKTEVCYVKNRFKFLYGNRF